MLPIAYASSEGSDEPAHPRKIASALTAHIHNEGACGCEFKISKAIEMIGTSHMSVEVCTPTLLHAKTSLCTTQTYLEQNVKHFVGQVLGPNRLLN